jgi:hypothetical protein
LSAKIKRWTPNSKHYYCYIKGKNLKIKSEKFIVYINAIDWIEKNIRKYFKIKNYFWIGDVDIKLFHDHEGD